MATHDSIRVALEYLGAVERKEFHRIKELLSPELQFEGPSGSHSTASAFISTLKRLTAIHVRSDIRRVFADGDEACVIFADAEDLVQDTLLRAWRARASYAADAPTAHWLMRIATNACLNALSRGRRRQLPQLDYDSADATTALDKLEPVCTGARRRVAPPLHSSDPLRSGSRGRGHQFHREPP